MASKKRKKLWMLPAGGVMMAGGLACIAVLLSAMQFTLPKKPALAAEIHSAPMLDRSVLDYVPPREEPKEAEEKEDFVYTMSIDINKVRSAAAGNPNIVGWIRIPDTPINYAVMQSDDNDFYVHHDASGRASFAGAIFADCRCNLESSDNTLIYGHNMGNGSMFHAIKNYKDHDWGMNHRYLELATLNHRYLYRVLSCNVIFGEQGASFEYWNFINMNRGDVRYFYDSVQRTAGTWYGDDFDVLDGSGDKRLLVLQTCNSGASDGMRCCLFAELVGDATFVPQYSEKSGLPGYKSETLETVPYI
ncbi:MAG: class B sortase [Oscillospiraceae bacterium]|nr:class B sortase [Oscillospiraceae bacterium]